MIDLKAIAREVASMKRRGYSPDAIMRTWRLTPAQYHKCLDGDIGIEAMRDVEATHRHSMTHVEYRGRSPTGGY